MSPAVRAKNGGNVLFLFRQYFRDGLTNHAFQLFVTEATHVNGTAILFPNLVGVGYRVVPVKFGHTHVPDEFWFLADPTAFVNLALTVAVEFNQRIVAF